MLSEHTSPEISLADALERFNRKERLLLLRAATMIEDAKLQLSKAFLEKVRNTLGLPETIPVEAWWATDYHIAWIAGALSLFQGKCGPWEDSTL